MTTKEIFDAALATETAAQKKYDSGKKALAALKATLDETKQASWKAHLAHKKFVNQTTKGAAVSTTKVEEAVPPISSALATIK